MPLSSKHSAHLAATQRGGTDEFAQASSARSAHKVNAPAYTELVVLTWLFRILAFVALGVLTKFLLRNVDSESSNAFRIVVALVVAVAGFCALWLLGELARAVRDVARNSFNR